MSHITHDKFITINGKTWKVNSNGSGLISHVIKSMINQVDVVLSHHSKIHIIRFDLRMREYTDKNDVITKFNRMLHSWLKREYKLKRIGYVWCREQDSAEAQHYHYALMVDGHKVNYPDRINDKVKEIWRKVGGSEYFPENCFYNIKRNDHQSIQEAIYRISYLAKPRTKGKRPPQTKDYSTSRIRMK